jgi:transcriptional regulator with XRE-family HTH domain
VSQKLVRNLRVLKAAKNLSVSDLAHIIDVTDAVMKNFMSGRTPVPMKHIITLAEYFGVDVNMLLSDTIDDKKLYILHSHKGAKPRPGDATSPPEQDHFYSKPDLTQIFDNEMQEVGVISYYNGTLMTSPHDVLNQTVQPTYRMVIPEYSDCAYSFTIHGDDMNPTLKSGTIVLCKPVTNKHQIKYGSIYYVIVNEFHMFRRLIKSDTTGMIIAAADNETTNKAGNRIYADIEMPIEEISILYLIKAHINRLET